MSFPCSDFNDLKLVLDSRTYENFEGGWRDLFVRIKWDTVKSVVKSVTGLQGRKFKVIICPVFVLFFSTFPGKFHSSFPHKSVNKQQELLPEAPPDLDVAQTSGTGSSSSKGFLEVLGIKKGRHSRSVSDHGATTLTEEQVQVQNDEMGVEVQALRVTLWWGLSVQ